MLEWNYFVRVLSLPVPPGLVKGQLHPVTDNNYRLSSEKGVVVEPLSPLLGGFDEYYRLKLLLHKRFDIGYNCLLSCLPTNFYWSTFQSI